MEKYKKFLVLAPTQQTNIYKVEYIGIKLIKCNKYSKHNQSQVPSAYPAV